MKKVIFGVCLFLVNDIYAQEKVTSQSCNYKPETKQFIKAVDSLANFVKSIKKTVSAGEWNNFATQVDNEDGLNSFNAFGLRANSLQNEYLSIGIDATGKLNQLISQLDPERQKTADEIKSMIQQEVNCYLTDTVENSQEALFNDFGRPAPLNIGGGPCERDARACKDNAQNAFIQNMTTCGFGGAGIIAVFSNFWGWITGGGCALIAINRRTNAINTCADNYYDCLGIPNPLDLP